jgi:hypothetical protein
MSVFVRVCVFVCVYPEPLAAMHPLTYPDSPTTAPHLFQSARCDLDRERKLGRLFAVKSEMREEGGEEEEET